MKCDYFSRRLLPRRVLTLCILLFCVLLLAATSVSGSTEQRIRETIVYLEQQNYSEALETLDRLSNVMLDSAKLNELWAAAYLGRGYQLLKSGELAAARESFQSGRIYRENDVRLWQGEAICWMKEGRYLDAASVIDQAIGYNPQNADLYHLMGQAYYAAGRMPEALDALHRSQTLAKTDKVANLLNKVRKEWQVEQEMEQDYRGHFQLSFVDDGPSTEMASVILSSLEDAYAEIGADLNYYPDILVPVLIYTRSEYTHVTGSPDWSGALYDGKIRLPLAGVESMHEQLVALLYHEYMHVLVHFMTKGQAPVWLNEGLAEAAGRRIYSDPHGHMVSLEPEVLLDWQKLSGPFTNLVDVEVPLAYEQSFLLTTYMIDNYGWFRMTELLHSLGKGNAWQDAVAEVYQEFGLNWSAILSEWQTSMK